MNTRRSRSSPISSSFAVSKFATAISCWVSSSRPSSACLRSRSLFRRKRSMARCLAVAMSQAPGLSGTPDSGHRSRAATRASCASSSARPASRTIRARPAMSLADSILQTASMMRCVSEDDTATFQAKPEASRAKVRPRRGTQGLRFRTLGVRILVGLVYLAKLALTIMTGYLEEILDQFDRFFLRVRAQECESADDLLGFGKRTVGDSHLSTRHANARAKGAWQAAFGGEQRAGLHLVLDQFAHLGHFLL